ncbi:MAG: maleylpyruvate isomerase N-terminal domain-containing protein, partial [Marmoricola sp.]
MTAAESHRQRAEAFSTLVSGVTDWSAPSPVAGWTAEDVVTHLVYWPANFLANAGVELDPVPADPVGAWTAHAARMQRLFDDEPDLVISGTPMGPQPLAQLLDQIYTGDVFLHSWDLAKASAQEP